MGKKLYPTDTFKQAESILSSWQLIDRTLEFGPLTLEAFETEIARVTGLKHRLIALHHELTEIRHQRDAAILDLWDKVKGMRTVVKVIYGDDSTQYDLVGAPAGVIGRNRDEGLDRFQSKTRMKILNRNIYLC
jgi:hypothetical protein